MSDDLIEQNRVLRERVAELERALSSGKDPLERAMLEHAGSYISVVSPEGRLLATARTGESWGSVIGRSTYEFVDGPSGDLMRSVFAQVVETGKTVVYESVGYGEDGTPGHRYVTRAVPVLEAGAVRALVLVSTDITDRVRLERSLHEKEQTLHMAVEATRMGLWNWDALSNEVQWDARLCEIWGVTSPPKDYAGYVALVHPEDRARVAEMVQHAIDTGVFEQLEHRVATPPDQPERWLLSLGSAFRDEHGKVTRLMGGALDITEQRRVAQHVARAERVEAVGQLTAGLAHNFNNLLATIVPNLELALLDIAEPARTGLAAALDASLQARDLVRSLLTLARDERAVVPEPADLSSVVTRMISLCQVTFPREISLRHKVGPGVGCVAMSAGNLEQVLLNLLFNARDAVEARDGGPREICVRVDLATDAGVQTFVRLSVEDTGVGMCDTVMARVFEPFFTTKPAHKGSGLGLSNVAERVREAGGSITCDSALGQGTTFTMLLPTHDKLPAADVATLEEQPQVVTACVLLVDDEPLVRGVVRRVLEQDGMEVIEAASAAEARTVLERHGGRVTLVILDQSMPHETGTEALASLQERTNAPVILFTGMAPELPPGIVALLEKPARPAELLRLVRQVVSDHSPRRS